MTEEDKAMPKTLSDVEDLLQRESVESYFITATSKDGELLLGAKGEIDGLLSDALEILHSQDAPKALRTVVQLVEKVIHLHHERENRVIH